jgi:hypothetical protein
MIRLQYNHGTKFYKFSKIAMGLIYRENKKLVDQLKKYAKKGE